jgi:hypothetical protein
VGTEEDVKAIREKSRFFVECSNPGCTNDAAGSECVNCKRLVCTECRPDCHACATGEL